MDSMLVWNVVLTLIIVPFGWFVSQMNNEVKRLNILINITRENYVKREDHQNEISRVIDHLVRLEEKIDKLAERR